MPSGGSLTRQDSWVSSEMAWRGWDARNRLSALRGGRERHHEPPVGLGRPGMPAPPSSRAGLAGLEIEDSEPSYVGVTIASPDPATNPSSEDVDARGPSPEVSPPFLELGSTSGVGTTMPPGRQYAPSGKAAVRGQTWDSVAPRRPSLWPAFAGPRRRPGDHNATSCVGSRSTREPKSPGPAGGRVCLASPCHLSRCVLGRKPSLHPALPRMHSPERREHLRAFPVVRSR